MPHSRVVSLFVFSVLVTQAGLFGQGVRNAEVSPDDPELYFGLFSLHQAIKASITHTEGKEAAAAKQMAAANEFHISTEDFQGALTVGGLVLQRIASLTREARNYYDSEVGAGRTPDRTVLDGFSRLLKSEVL